MAWLNAAPRPHNHKPGDPDPETRIAAMVREGVVPPIPPNPARYLTDWLFEIGPAVPAGMGRAAIGWADMAAWQAVSGIDLLPWEGALLRALSRAFIDQLGKAEKPDCPEPWSEASAIAANRAAVSRKLEAAFATLQGK